MGVTAVTRSDEDGHRLAEAVEVASARATSVPRCATADTVTAR